MADVDVLQAEVVLREALVGNLYVLGTPSSNRRFAVGQRALKCDVGQLKYRWFVKVVHFAVSELINSAGAARHRSINKGQYHFALTCACSEQALHIMYLLGFDDKLGMPESMILDDYKQNEPALRAFYKLGLKDMILCAEDPMRHTSIAALDDVPSVLAHFVYNMRFRFELLTINTVQHSSRGLDSEIYQAIALAEKCAIRLRLLGDANSDNCQAWKNVKQRTVRYLSGSFPSGEEQSGLQHQIEEMCGRFGNALSESLSHRLRSLLGFGQNIKAVLCITDGMYMVDMQAAEIYMNTTSELPCDAFSSEFMDITEQLRACMRQVIAEPYKDTPEEVIELVHRLSVWQVEHFLSHFRQEAYNVSDVFGSLRSHGMESLPLELIECFPGTGHRLSGHADVQDESESSCDEEKRDVSEKELTAEDVAVSTDTDFDHNKESAVSQLDDMQSFQVESRTHNDADDKAVALTEDKQIDNNEHQLTTLDLSQVDFGGSLEKKEYMSHSTNNMSKPEREHTDLVAIVRPRIPCEGLVDGLSMEEWETLVASVDSNAESSYKVREQLAAAVCDLKETVIRLQNEIATMMKLSGSGNMMDDTHGDKQRKLFVAETWIEKMQGWSADLEQAICKIQSKTIRDVVDCEVLKNLLTQVIEEHSPRGVDTRTVLRLVAAVSHLIHKVDVYTVLSDMFS